MSHHNDFSNTNPGVVDERKVYDTFKDEFTALGKLFQQPTCRANGMAAAGTLPRNSISDHLPIIVKASGIPIAMSYNMLSDQHIYNNLFTVSGVKGCYRPILEVLFHGNVYLSRLHMFFYELAEYARQEQGFGNSGMGFIYTTQMFDEFLASDYFTKTTDPVKSKTDRLQIGEWIKQLPDKGGQSISKMDMALSFAQSLQELHHIEYGGLKYHAEVEDSRIDLLLSNNKLFDQFYDVLRVGGFINLQECTDPVIILGMLNRYGNYEAIIHNITSDTTDNCVMIYNRTLFKVPPAEQIRLFTLDRNKPGIIAVFEKIDGSSTIIVGSIHHPGGNKNEMDVITSHINELNAQFPNAKVIITGDFNHESSYFEQAARIEGMLVRGPEKGTMAGPDYGNQNKPIDIAFARNLGEITVDRFDKGMFSVPSNPTSDVVITVSLGGGVQDVTLAPREYFALAAHTYESVLNSTGPCMSGVVLVVE